MAKVAMMIDKTDHVATCIAPLRRGEAVELMLSGRKRKKIKAKQSIPFAHKICVKAMKKAHPYETPAFDVWRLSDMQF